MTTTIGPLGWTWEDVLARLGEHVDLEETARRTGALQRARVIRTASQLLRLVLAYVLSGFSLRSTAAWAEAAAEASLSDVAVLKRLRRCAPWLAELVGTLGGLLQPEAAGGEEGRRVVAVDATAIASPGGKTKRYRLLHTVYDVGAQRFTTTQLTERTLPERLDVGEITPGEIRLGDRAYGRYTDLAAVQRAGADYVVRLSAKALRLAKAGSPGRGDTGADPTQGDQTGAEEREGGRGLNRAALCRRAECEGVQDTPVLVCDTQGGAPLEARLIVLPLAPDKAEAARRQMRRKARQWGYTPSDEALATAGCLMLITSLSAQAWPATRVLGLYRLRWQAELAFKRLKSLLALESLRAFDPELVSAWVHGVLLMALLIELERPDLERPSAEPEGPLSPPEGSAALCPSGASSPSWDAA